jgi:hypothetical protein
MKVARDAANLYFYARTAAPLSPPTDPHWMWLLLSTGHPGHPTWEGYDFIVNRTIDPDGSTWIERCEGGWHWKKLAKIEMRAVGAELQLAIPKRLLDLPETGAFHLDFKWADHLQHPGDVMDFYVSGDVAPEGRLMFRYSAE